MTTQPEIEFPSSPIEGDTRATVELVGEDWLAEGTDDGSRTRAVESPTATGRTRRTSTRTASANLLTNSTA